MPSRVCMYVAASLKPVYKYAFVLAGPGRALTIALHCTRISIWLVCLSVTHG